MFHTYILHSQSTQQFYTGQTADLTNRLNEHNNGETKSIAKGIPWMLVWSVECDNRSQAMQWEKKIKSRGAKRFLLDLGIGM